MQTTSKQLTGLFTSILDDYLSNKYTSAQAAFEAERSTRISELPPFQQHGRVCFNWTNFCRKIEVRGHQPKRRLESILRDSGLTRQKVTVQVGGTRQVIEVASVPNRKNL